MESSGLAAALALSTPASAAATGDCKWISLGYFVPPFLLRRSPYLRRAAIHALEGLVLIVPALDELGLGVAVVSGNL
jgi:hypothetical protein